jgi:transposase InsO family protein
LYTRLIVGWAMLGRMTAALTICALKMAIRRCQPEAGLIHHSDQGSQYTDGTYQALLRDHGIQASMNGVGSWYDNAPMESFFGTLKSELVHHEAHQSRDEAKPDFLVVLEMPTCLQLPVDFPEGRMQGAMRLHVRLQSMTRSQCIIFRPP